jgi:hypothetical protein
MVGTNDYHATLVHLMTFTNGIAYAKDHQLVQDELAPLTPDDVARCGCAKRHTAHQNPTPTQLKLDSHRSSHYWKKAISYYMPNRLIPWNAISGQGNPTRSIEVNTLADKKSEEKGSSKTRG